MYSEEEPVNSQIDHRKMFPTARYSIRCQSLANAAVLEIIAFEKRSYPGVALRTEWC